MTSRCLTSTWCMSSPCRSTSSWRRWRRKSLPDWNRYNSITGEVLIKTIKDYQNDKDCNWHYGRSIGAFKNTRRHIIIKQEGNKNEEELKRGHGIIFFMANIKQDELWVDLLFDGTTSFYLALAESKRFRLGHIRNGKISYQLYPKRKDFVSLNVAIKNLAAGCCALAVSSATIWPHMLFMLQTWSVSCRFSQYG